MNCFLISLCGFIDFYWNIKGILQLTNIFPQMTILGVRPDNTRLSWSVTITAFGPGCVR